MYRVEGLGDWKHTIVWRDGVQIPYNKCEIVITSDNCSISVDGVRGDIERIIINGMYTFISFGSYNNSKLFTDRTELRGVQEVYVVIEKDQHPLLSWKSVLLPNIVDNTDRLTIDDCLYYGGLLDGEGTITLKKQRVGYVPRITIYNNDKPVLDYLHKIFKYSYVYPRKVRSTNHKESFVFEIIGYDDCGDFLKTILPYLRIKRAVGSKVLEFINGRNKFTSYTDEEIQLIQDIRLLNHRGT